MKILSYWCPECGLSDTAPYDCDDSDPISEDVDLWLCEDCGAMFYPHEDVAIYEIEQFMD